MHNEKVLGILFEDQVPPVILQVLVSMQLCVPLTLIVIQRPGSTWMHSCLSRAAVSTSSQVSRSLCRCFSTTISPLCLNRPGPLLNLESPSTVLAAVHPYRMTKTVQSSFSQYVLDPLLSSSCQTSSFVTESFQELSNVMTSTMTTKLTLQPLYSRQKYAAFLDTHSCHRTADSRKPLI